MSRAVIAIGGSASVGKTTLGRAIAERLLFDRVVHVDDLKRHVAASAAPSFIDATPNVWNRPVTWLRDSLIASTRSLYLEIAREITALVACERGGVVEGEGVEPALFDGYSREVARPVYVIEADGERLRETFAHRSSGARFLALSAAEQNAVVEMNRRYGAWLRDEAELRGQAWVPAQPWDTLVDRVLVALAAY